MYFWHTLFLSRYFCNVFVPFYAKYLWYSKKSKWNPIDISKRMNNTTLSVFRDNSIISISITKRENNIVDLSIVFDSHNGFRINYLIPFINNWFHSKIFIFAYQSLHKNDRCHAACTCHDMTIRTYWFVFSTLVKRKIMNCFYVFCSSRNAIFSFNCHVCE